MRGVVFLALDAGAEMDVGCSLSHLILSHFQSGSSAIVSAVPLSDTEHMYYGFSRMSIGNEAIGYLAHGAIFRWIPACDIVHPCFS